MSGWITAEQTPRRVHQERVDLNLEDGEVGRINPRVYALCNGKSCTLQVGVTGKQSRVMDSGCFEVKTTVHFEEKIFNISIRQQAGKDSNVLQSPQSLFVATGSWLLDHLSMLQLLETIYFSPVLL